MIIFLLYIYLYFFRYVNPTSLVSYGNVTSFCPDLLFREGKSGMRKAECSINRELFEIRLPYSVDLHVFLSNQFN